MSGLDVFRRISGRLTARAKVKVKVGEKTLHKVRGKIWCDNPEDLLKAMDFIRSQFTPNFTSSDVRRSREGDFHIMFTIYLVEGRDDR